MLDLTLSSPYGLGICFYRVPEVLRKFLLALASTGSQNPGGNPMLQCNSPRLTNIEAGRTPPRLDTVRYVPQ